MSGNEHDNHCRIGKVTLKPRALILQKEELTPRASGRTRSLFVDALRAIDLSAQSGVFPVVGFFGVAFSDGTVNISTRMNEEPTDEVLNALNWRNLTMLFEDMANDTRNFQHYHQATVFDDVVREESALIEEED